MWNDNLLISSFCVKHPFNLVCQPSTDNTSNNCFSCISKFTVRPVAVHQHHQKLKVQWYCQALGMQEVWSSQQRKYFKSASDGPKKYSRKFPKHQAHLAGQVTNASGSTLYHLLQHQPLPLLGAHSPYPSTHLSSPTAHHGHHWVCLSTAELCFDSEQSWPYWMMMMMMGTFKLENSYKNKISNKKYKTSKIPSPNFSWDLAVIGEDQAPEATKSN